MLTGFAWGRDTGRTDLDRMKPHTLPSGSRTQRDLLPLPHGECGVRGKAPKWVKGLVPCGVQGQSPCPAEHNSIYGENTGQILETRALGGRNRTDTTMCPPPLQIAGKACNSMYLSHFHRLRQWIQKRVQIIKLSQK